MKHRLFTLVELLTVIAVIAILAGIAVPVVVGMQSKGRETSARADMNAIKMALTQFKADYSVWPQINPSSNQISNWDDITASGDLLIEAPFDKSDSGNPFKASIIAYDRISQALTNNVVNATEPDSLTNSASDSNKEKYHYGNNKKKRYLDPPAKAIKFSTLSTDYEGFYKLDPWGRRYNIALDWNYNGKIDLDNASKKKFCRDGEKKPILGQILIYSYGTATKDEDDDFDTDAFLCSWKTNSK